MKTLTKDKLQKQLEALLAVHGEDFWSSLFAMISPDGHCGRCCRRPIVRYVGAEPIAACDFCGVYWPATEAPVPDPHPAGSEYADNAALLQGYELIEPKFPLMTYADNAGLFEVKDQDLWFVEQFLTAMDTLVRDPAARAHLVNQIAEAELMGPTTSE